MDNRQSTLQLSFLSVFLAN